MVAQDTTAYGWDLNQRELSARNQIVAPRIYSYHRPFSGEGWDRARPQTPESAREWVRFAAMTWPVGPVGIIIQQVVQAAHEPGWIVKLLCHQDGLLF